MKLFSNPYRFLQNMENLIDLSSIVSYIRSLQSTFNVSFRLILCLKHEFIMQNSTFSSER